MKRQARLLMETGHFSKRYGLEPFWIAIFTTDAGDAISSMQFHTAKQDIGFAPNRTCREAERQINEWLRGKRTEFDLEKLKIKEHTDWQKTLNGIAYGETISYEELAKRHGGKVIAKNAGQACSKNKIPLIVPCHRVWGKKNKAIGGYCGSTRNGFYSHLKLALCYHEKMVMMGKMAY